MSSCEDRYQHTLSYPQVIVRSTLVADNSAQCHNLRNTVRVECAGCPTASYGVIRKADCCSMKHRGHGGKARKAQLA
jgi:hypothetical protein